MSRKPKAAAPTMWEQAEEVPRAGIPSTEKLAKRMRWYRRVIWACVLSFPLMGLGLVVTAASLKAASVEEEPPAAVSPAGRAAAMNAVTVWLAGDPQPLPGGILVSWDEAVTLPAFKPGKSTSKQEIADAATLEEHHMTVRDAAGATYIAQVLVASNRLGEASAVGLPSLLPNAPASDWASSVSPWPNQETISPSDSVLTAVDAWVESFTSGDPAKLRLTVGDPDATHAYMPMSGVLSATGKAGTASWVLGDDGLPTSDMLVQVSVSFTWPSTDTVRSGGPQAALYDLLVTGSDSAAPQVVAWGGSGSGPVLSKYGNAIEGLTLKAAPEAVATPAPSAPAVDGAASE